MSFFASLWMTIMKTIGAIEASKQRVLAWSNILLDTFRELGISDTEVINHCHIGRSTFYYMKQGELINADAYVRLKDYAIMKIREQEAKGLVPGSFRKEWKRTMISLFLNEDSV